MLGEDRLGGQERDHAAGSIVANVTAQNTLRLTDDSVVYRTHEQEAA